MQKRQAEHEQTSNVTPNMPLISVCFPHLDVEGEESSLITVKKIVVTF